MPFTNDNDDDDAAAAPSEPASDAPRARRTTVHPAKVTARMLRLRELIAQGEYPDLDELAERIADDRGVHQVVWPVPKPRST